MSKAWQLAADAFAKAGQRDRAADAAKKGYEIAALRGDLMPKNAIASILKDLGLPLPEVKGAAVAPTGSPLAATGTFVCRQTGRPGSKLPAPPFRGPVGQWIFENIAAETWKAWIAQGTKVINELRLDLSREQDAETYDRHMREYLGIDDGVLASLCG
jgi:Fe-S cluster biosynthesis and repair protein YggX